MIQGGTPEGNAFDLWASATKQSMCRQEGMATGKQTNEQANKTRCMACHKALAVR